MIQLSIFMKIRLVIAELFHVDGWAGRQTDRHDEILVAFRIIYERAQILTLGTYTFDHIYVPYYKCFVTQVIFLNHQ